MAATAATRKRTAKLVAPESTKAAGFLHILPAGAPEVIEASYDEHIAVAAMGDPKKGATKAKQSVKKVVKAATKTGIKPPTASAKKASQASNKNPKPGASKSKPETVIAPPAITSGSQKSNSTGREGDPDVAYAFTVMIANVAYAMFSEISGLSWKAEPIPVREGGNNEYSRNMRGPGKFEPLTLKRGWFAATGEFFDMLKASLDGAAGQYGGGGGLDPGRVNMTITVLNRKYSEIGQYHFTNAFIIEYSGPSLNSMSGSVGFEQIRMAYDKFTYVAK